MPCCFYCSGSIKIKMFNELDRWSINFQWQTIRVKTIVKYFLKLVLKCKFLRFNNCFQHGQLCVSLTHSRAYLKIANLPINASQWNWILRCSVHLCVSQCQRPCINRRKPTPLVHSFIQNISDSFSSMGSHLSMLQCVCVCRLWPFQMPNDYEQTKMTKSTHKKNESMWLLSAVNHNTNAKKLYSLWKLCAVVMHDIAISCSFTIFIFPLANNNEWNGFST